MFLRGLVLDAVPANGPSLSIRNSQNVIKEKLNNISQSVTSTINQNFIKADKNL